MESELFSTPPKTIVSESGGCLPSSIFFTVMPTKLSDTLTYKGSSDIYAGTPFPAYRNVFAIPTTDIVANKNLIQNAGY